MRLVRLFPVLFLVFSCSTLPQEATVLKLSDLRFGDYERDAIIREKVDSVYGMRSQPFRDLEESMTYSPDGSLLYHFEYFRNHQWYTYTQDGLKDRVVSQLSLDSMDYKLNYKFIVDSLLLYEAREPVKHGYVVSSKYLFHPNGYIRERTDYFERTYVTTQMKMARMFRKYFYSYDDEWRLTSVISSDQNDELASRLVLHYSEGLDSTSYLSLHPFNHSYVKTVYDDRGLRQYQLKWDTFPNMGVKPRFDSVVWRSARRG